MPDRRAPFEDLADLARGAAAVCRGLGRAAAERLGPGAERLRESLGGVPREDFEAVREMAEKARAENQRLARRIAALEGKGKARASSSSRTARKKKPAAPNRGPGGSA